MAKVKPRLADCRTCGACCTLPVWLDSQEVKFFAARRHLRRLIVLGNSKTWYMRREDQSSACVALRGKVGEKCSCAIYGDRPSGCREFRPGNPKCLELREEFGLREATKGE